VQKDILDKVERTLRVELCRTWRARPNATP